MSKRILISSTDLMMIQFLVPHVINLADNGYEIEIACSNVGGKIEQIKERLKNTVKKIHVVKLARNPFTLRNFKGYKEMKQIISKGDYDIIWTNEPVMGVVTRLAAKLARRRGTTVLYMVHGFHFFTGAPIINWLIYYPVEKIMAKYADMIVTVNHEDYKRAKSMNVKRVEYIHGIGINTDRLSAENNSVDIRKELGLSSEDFLIISVGELNKNKNQKTIIKALAQIKDPAIHYLLCGKGNQLESLKKQVIAEGLDKQIHFLGYRTDVLDICRQADVYVMPSYREGLPVASLEAMYCGLPLLTSNIRGLVDVMENGSSGYMYSPDDYKGFADGLCKLLADPELRKKMGKRNQEYVNQYCIDATKKEVLDLVFTLSGGI
ncbi:glycosyltransferase family 4 protein [Faecalicatena contorta]|uniref:glycosyltransferase family 4 protein n=1 Tax=Faecalicatena contorta TaxID=39482 RepID=UPI00196205AC|nr:glycosyltransferase family 4 protein [Faecalicatena contorta]MBM6684755.1 glycosyltransferase family 4 protein [Faecalicatena contorta]MBM6710063.1 glycosyltransferase family 4 protein [Faecalicatena contorta]